MNRKILSIAIGEYKTKICVIDDKKKHPYVYQTLVFDTPPDCVKDGFITNREAMAKSIFNQQREADIHITNVVFTITSSRIVTHEVLIPMVKPKEIKEYVNAGASDYFPIDISEYVLSYIILEKIQTEQSRNYRLFVIAARSDLLESYYALAKELKLNMTSIDYRSNSILQMIQKQINYKDLSMFVQINEKDTLLYILNGAALKFHRMIAYGTADTHEVMMNSIGRITEYYVSKDPEHPIQKVYLSGAGAKHADTVKLLQSELGLPVIIQNDLNGVNFHDKRLPEDCAPSDFLDCIGAVVAPLGIVPKQYSGMVQQKGNMKVMIEAAGLVVLLSVILMLSSFLKVSSALAARDRVDTSIASLKKVEKIYSKNREVTGKLNLLKTIDDNCYCNTEKLNDLLSEFKEKLPKSIVINSLSVDQTKITMNVVIDSKDAAAMTFIQMDTIDLLTDIKTDKIAVDTDDYGATTLNYIITAQFTSDNSSSVRAAE